MSLYSRSKFARAVLMCDCRYTEAEINPTTAPLVMWTNGEWPSTTPSSDIKP